MSKCKKIPKHKFAALKSKPILDDDYDHFADHNKHFNIFNICQLNWINFNACNIFNNLIRLSRQILNLYSNSGSTFMYKRYFEFFLV